MFTQEEITIWEIENKTKFTGWEVHYKEEFDIVVFKNNKTTIKEFKRAKKIKYGNT